MDHRRRRGMGRGPRGHSGGESSWPRRESSDQRPAPERVRPAPYPERPRPSFVELFRTSKPVIGVVHLKPLPGSPGYDGQFLDLLDAALADARALEAGGAAGLIVENFGDAPFYSDIVPAETIAAMTRLVTEVRKVVRIPVGVNVLRNDARGGVAVAAATGAGFVRINVHTGVMVSDQGILAGRAYESVRLRETLRSRTLLFADVRVKHAAPLATFDLLQEAEETVLRGKADALIITGSTTGRAADLSQVSEIKEAFPHIPVVVGSGVDGDSIEAVLRVADGCIVGSWIKLDGEIERPVDSERVRELVAVADRMAPRLPVERPRPPEGRGWEPRPPAPPDREFREPREERAPRNDREPREYREPRDDRGFREERGPRRHRDRDRWSDRDDRRREPDDGRGEEAGRPAVPVYEPHGTRGDAGPEMEAPEPVARPEAWSPPAPDWAEPGEAVESPGPESPQAAEEPAAEAEVTFGRSVTRKKRR